MKGGNQGAYAEGKVRDFLKGWASTHSNFCFNRILDAKSALGAMANSQPGDFQWFQRMSPLITRNGLIEVKSVQHAYRLPHKNFGEDQVGRMRIRQLAGSEPLVLICFRPEDGKTRWCCPEFEFFQQRDGGSWDMRDFEMYEKPNLLLENYLS